GETSVESSLSGIAVQLGPAATIVGRIEDSHPVASFQLTATSSTSTSYPFFQTAEFPGDHFELTEVPPGDVNIEIQTADGRAGSAHVDVTPSKTNSVTVHLARGGSFRGRAVIASSSRPSPTARVLVLDGPQTPLLQVESDGRFQAK